MAQNNTVATTEIENPVVIKTTDTVPVTAPDADTTPVTTPTTTTDTTSATDTAPVTDTVPVVTTADTIPTVTTTPVIDTAPIVNTIPTTDTVPVTNSAPIVNTIPTIDTATIIDATPDTERDLYVSSDIISTNTIYTIGDTLTIKWTGKGIKPTERIAISIVQGFAPNSVVHTVNIPFSKGEYVYKLTGKWRVGNYGIGFAPVHTSQNAYVQMREHISVQTITGLFAFNFTQHLDTLTPIKVVMGPVPPIVYNSGEKNNSPAVNLNWNTTNHTNPTDRMRIYVVPQGTPESELENWFVQEMAISNPIMGASNGWASVTSNYINFGNSVFGESTRQLDPGIYNIILKPVTQNLDPTSVTKSPDIKVVSSFLTIQNPPTVIYRGEKFPVQWSVNEPIPAGRMKTSIFLPWANQTVILNGVVAGNRQIAVPKTAPLGNQTIRVIVDPVWIGDLRNLPPHSYYRAEESIQVEVKDR